GWGKRGRHTGGEMTERGHKPASSREEAKLAAVGRRLGLSHNMAGFPLGRLPRAEPVRCRQCQRVITRGESGLDNLKRRPLCLRCLARMPDPTFGERLRALRLAQGLSRARLAEAAGVPATVIRAHERNEVRSPRYDTLVKLARVLGPMLVGLAG